MINPAKEEGKKKEKNTMSNQCSKEANLMYGRLNSTPFMGERKKS